MNFDHAITRAIAPVILGMCKFPAECEIHETVTPSTLDICLVPHAADAPIMVGKNGRQINAIKFVASTAGAVCGVKCDVRLLNSYRGERAERAQFFKDPNFDREKFFDHLHGLLEVCFPAATPTFVCEGSDTHDRLVIRLTLPEGFTNPAIVYALEDMFHPYGWQQGQRLKISYEKHPMGAGTVLGQQ